MWKVSPWISQWVRGGGCWGGEGAWDWQSAWVPEGKLDEVLGWFLQMHDPSADDLKRWRSSSEFLHWHARQTCGLERAVPWIKTLQAIVAFREQCCMCFQLVRKSLGSEEMNFYTSLQCALSLSPKIGWEKGRRESSMVGAVGGWTVSTEAIHICGNNFCCLCSM